jgi:hypothetical protein
MTVSETVPLREPAHLVDTLAVRRRGSLFTLAVIATYVGLGIVAFWPLFPDFHSRLFGTGADSILATWFLAWVPHSLARGLNPFFSHAIFVPDGVNLAQNTQAPLLGLLTAPFAIFLGPVARANLLMILAMPASATAAFVVLRKWRVWAPAAALGGLIYGFSPYASGHSLGHVVLVFLPLPPFIAYVFASILLQRGSPRRLGLVLGLLLAAQFLCEPEVFTTIVILLVWALVCLAVRYPRRIAEVARYSGPALGIAVTVAAILLAYPIWMMLAGPQHYTGTAQPFVNPYYNDLLGFLDPGPLQRFSLGMRSLGGPASNASELSGFIGLPVLVVAALFAFKSRRSPRMQMALTVMFGAAILSLGRHLSFNGFLTRVPLPYVILAHLPLVNNIMPVRLSMEVHASLAAVISFGLDDFRRGVFCRRAPSSARQHGAQVRDHAALAAIAVLAVLAVTQFPRWPYEAQEVHVLPTEIRQAMPPGDPVVLTYPYATAMFPAPMLWQLEDGFAFRLVGGYAMHPDMNGKPTGLPNPLEPPGLEAFLTGQEGYNPYVPAVPITPELLASTRASLSANHIEAVLVDNSVKGASPVVDLFTQVLGRPEVSAGTFLLWITAEAEQ